MKNIILTLLYVTILTATSYAKTVPTEQKIAGLYIAFFNRAPDMSGLSYWTNRANIAQNNGQGASGVFRELSAGFATHPVFTSTYGSLNNEEFVKAIYVNSLGREGDSEGIAYWTNQLNNGLSRSDMVASFIELSLTLDLTPQNFPNLSQSELDAAKLRQDLITNKTVVALAFVNRLGSKTNVADTQDPENDPAYKASIKILSKVNEDPETPSAARAYLGDIAGSLNPIQKILDEWGVDILKNTTSILSLSAHLNGLDLMDTLIPGEEATIRLLETPSGAIKVHLQTLKGSEEIIPTYVSDNNITFVAPLDTIAGTLNVESADFSTFGISYKTMSKQAPFIETVEPEVATVGERVTITGKNFPMIPVQVVFEGQESSFTQTVTPSENNVSFTIPQGAASGNVYLQIGQIETNRVYLSVKRTIDVHVSLGKDVAFDPSDISFILGLKEHTLDQNYTVTLGVENEDMQYLHAVVSSAEDNTSLLYSAVVLPDMAGTVTIDAQSTAIAWIFMGMGASVTTPKDQLRTLYDSVAANAEVQALADYIDTLQKEDFNAWAALSDATLKTKYQDALSDVIQTSQINPSQKLVVQQDSNGVTVTQEPENNNIYIDMNKLNKGSITIVNDTKLYLSVEVRDKKNNQIVNGYKHVNNAVLTDGGTLIGPQGWGLLDIASATTLDVAGVDSHLEIITAGFLGSTDKTALSNSLRARVVFEGMAIPAFNLLLTSIMDIRLKNGYKAKNFVAGMQLIYLNGDFLKQLTTEVSKEDNSISATVDTFIVKPVWNGLKGCLQPEMSDICKATIKGLALLIGINGTTEKIKDKIIYKIELSIGKSILKKTLVAIPVAGWIANAADTVYKSLPYISNISTYTKSLWDMKHNTEEINVDVDFPLEVSSVRPLCVAQTADQMFQPFQIGGAGFAAVDGENPEVFIGTGSDKTDASSVDVPTTGTDLVADFKINELMDEGSWEDYLFVENMGYAVLYPKPIRMVSAYDSKVYFDSIVPDRAMIGDTVTLKGCGWVPLDDLAVTFSTKNGSEAAEIVKKTIDEIKVIVPANVITGLINVKTGSKEASQFFYVDPFGLTDTVQQSVEEGKSLAINGAGLATVAHVYFVDHENNTYEGDITNVTDTGIWIDNVPAGLAVGPIRIYAVLGNGTKSNELTLPKLPKPPVITPQSSWFEKSITVTATQENNADIYYKLNETNSSEKLYTGALTFNATDMKYLDLNLYTFARVNVNGINYDSQMNHDTYSTCNEGEKVAYHDDGSGYCEGGDTNNSTKELYTYEDWKLECPKGMTLETNTDTNYDVIRYGCSNGSGDYYDLKDVYYTDATMQTLWFENDYILLSDNSTHHIHHIGYYNSGVKQEESFYAWGINPDGGYNSLMVSETYWYENGNKSREEFYWQKKNIDLTWSSDTSKTTDYFENGNVREETTYEPKLSDNRRWQSVETKVTIWNENGIKILENFYESKKNNDGYWYPIDKQSISWYDSGIMEEKSDYGSSIYTDGIWWSPISSVVNWNDNGVKVREATYTYTQAGPTEQIITYYPLSGNIKSKTINETKHQPEFGDEFLHVEEWLWYENGQVESEKHYEIKQKNNGYWEAFLVNSKQWWDNGTKDYESVSTLSEDNGTWYTASETDKSWYYNGNIHTIDTYTAVYEKGILVDGAYYENGVWVLEPSSSEEWDEKGNKIH